MQTKICQRQGVKLIAKMYLKFIFSAFFIKQIDYRHMSCKKKSIFIRRKSLNCYFEYERAVIKLYHKGTLKLINISCIVSQSINCLNSTEISK